LYRNVLKEILPQGGLIPIVVILGSSQEKTFISGIEKILRPHYPHIGRVDPEGTFINDRKIKSASDVFNQGLALLGNSSIDLILMHADSDKIMLTGLPFNYIDILFVADCEMSSYKNTPLELEGVGDLLTALIPMSRKGFFMSDAIDKVASDRFINLAKSLPAPKSVSTQSLVAFTSDILNILGSGR
jgi:hypothetical protein